MNFPRKTIDLAAAAGDELLRYSTSTELAGCARRHMCGQEAQPFSSAMLGWLAAGPPAPTY